MGMFADIQSIIPERLEHLLYKYGEVAKVYVAACNRMGETIVKFACSDEERVKIDELFPLSMRNELFSENDQ